MDTSSEMSPTSRAWIAQTATTLAVTGAAAWIALSADSIVRPDPHRYREGLFLVPWTLLAATLISVHRLQQQRSGALERLGIRALIASMAFVAVGNIGIVLTDADSNFAFPLGALLFIGGLMAFGVGTVRAGVFPRRVGVAIAVSQLATIATGVALSPIVPLHDYGSYSGAVAHGAVMLVLATSLQDHARNAGPVGAPV